MSEADRSDCTRCGACCESEVCPMGEAVYKTTTIPCKGLVRRGDVYACELIEILHDGALPIHLRNFQELNMGIGWGCTNEVKLSENTREGE